MSGIPKSWKTATIEDICSYVSRGKSPKYVEKSDLPVINQRCIRWDCVQEEHLKFVDPSTWDQWDQERFVRRGDILWNSTGTGTIGRATYFTCLNGWPRAVVDSHVTILRSSTHIDGAYLFNFVRSPAVQDKIEEMQTGSTNQVELNRGEILATAVPLPPLAEQRRIVAKLDSFTGRTARAREQLGRIPPLIQSYREAILSNAFDGAFVGLSSPEHITLSSYVESLDQGWSPKCESSASDDPKHWAVVKTTAIQPIHFVGGENKKLPSTLQPRPNIQIHAGDVLITRAGPRSRVGITCVVTVARPRLLLCDKAYRIRAKDCKADPTFLAMMLNSPQALRQIEEMKTGISDSGLNLTQDKILNLSLPKLELAQQLTTVRQIETAFVWLDRVAAEHKNASRLLPRLDQAILAKAFRGELVPQDPNDKPVEICAAAVAEGPRRRGLRKQASN